MQGVSSISEIQDFSCCETVLPIGAQDLHLWLCPREITADSDLFKRTVLSHYAPVAPDDWRFVAGEHGKPALVDAQRPLDFNLSDSGQWLACAVTAGAAVGVDIEYCNPAREVMKVARRFFQPGEIASLAACTSAERQIARFYDYWTLKEARIKASGAALGPGLESCGFELFFPANADQAGLITEHPRYSSAEAYYCLLEPVPDYRLALCSLYQGGVGPHLQVFELRDAGMAARLATPLRAVSQPHCERL